MALRVALRSTRAAMQASAAAPRSMAVRGFAAEVSKEDAAAALAAEDELMEKLTKQELEDAARTSTCLAVGSARWRRTTPPRRMALCRRFIEY